MPREPFVLLLVASTYTPVVPPLPARKVLAPLSSLHALLPIPRELNIHADNAPAPLLSDSASSAAGT